MAEPGDQGAPSRSVTSRALTVLEAFDHRHRHLTLSEIARRSHLPLATAHRLVADLVRWDALERMPDGTYQIGTRLWGVGTLSPVESSLREAAGQSMADLFAATGENVHLAVRDGLHALYVDKIRGRRSVPIVSHSGARLPLHATGVGKVLLAWGPPELLDQVSGRLSRVTPYTITDQVRLRRDLALVRSQGWASTVQEMTLGSWSVAAPVFAGTGAGAEAVAAMGIVAHSSRRDLRRFIPTLLAAAAETSRELSSGPSPTWTPAAAI